jgi:hypothetical protein
VCGDFGNSISKTFSSSFSTGCESCYKAEQFVENDDDDCISYCDSFAGFDIPVFSLLAKLLHEVLEVDYIHRSRCAVSFPILVNRFLDIAFANLGRAQNQDIPEFCKPSIRR